MTEKAKYLEDLKYLQELEKDTLADPNNISIIQDISTLSERIAHYSECEKNFITAELYYNKAIDNYKKTLEISPNNPVTFVFISKALDYLGNLYFHDLIDYEKAISCYNQALEYEMKLKKIDTSLPFSLTDKESPYIFGARSYRKLGEIYTVLGKFDEARANFIAGYRLLMEIHHEFLQVKYYLNALVEWHLQFAYHYDVQADLKNAEKNYRDAADIYEKLLDESDEYTYEVLIKTYSKIAEILSERDLPKLAKSFLNKAKKLEEIRNF